MYFLSKMQTEERLLILDCALRQRSVSFLPTAEMQLGLQELEQTRRTMRGPRGLRMCHLGQPPRQPGPTWSLG